jgi:Flp pilus assembly protein TadD
VKPTATAMLALARLTSVAGLVAAGACALQAQTNAFPEFQVSGALDYFACLAQSVAGESLTNAEVAFMLARIRSQLGRKDEAEQLARQALQNAPSHPEVRVFLADLLIRQDRMEEAKECLRDALNQQPPVSGVYHRLGMVLDRLGDHQGAREVFATAVRLSPDQAMPRLLLGRLLLDDGKAGEAKVQLALACRLDPALAGAQYALAEALTRLGEEEAARASRRTFRELQQQEKARLEAASAAYDSERELRALAATFHVELALLLGRRGQESLAESHLRQAIKVAPAEPPAYEILSRFYLRNQRLAEARRLLEELVRLRPRRVSDHVNLGTLLLQLQDDQAAVKELKRALELDANQPQALHNLARHYLARREETAEALALAQRLVRLEPSGASYDLLGWASYANGQTNEALAAAARAVEKEPANPAYRERYQRLRQGATGEPRN